MTLAEMLHDPAGAVARLLAAQPAATHVAAWQALAAALRAALAEEATQLPAVACFLVAASGLSVAGIGAAFWGLLAGAALWWGLRARG